MFNAAIIGVSGFGNVHYQDLLREHAAGRCRPVGAAIINREEEADKCAFLESIGCRIYDDYRVMLRELAGKIDICFIPTGIALHKPMTVAALEAGANVYVEKPVASTVIEAEAMMEAERRTGKFVAVGYQTMYQPENQKIKELILSGAIGKIHTLKSYALWPRDYNYYHRNNWAGKIGTVEHPVLDSPYSNGMAHYLNLLSFFAGRSFAEACIPATIEGGMYRANPIESCDTADLRIVTDDGVELFFSGSHATATNINPVSAIIGDRGSIEYGQVKNILRDAKGNVVEEFASAPSDRIRVNIYNALEKRLADPSTFICTVDVAARHTLICNAAFDSIPITQVPPEWIEVTGEGEQELRHIRNIEAAVKNAWQENRLFNTADLPFAARSQPFAFAGYHSYEGKLHK